MTTAACIPDDVLESLSLGMLSDDEAAAWEDHLLRCPACLERTRLLQSADTMVGALRAARGLPAAAPLSPVVEGLMNRLKNRAELETVTNPLPSEHSVAQTALMGSPSSGSPPAPPVAWANELLVSGTVLGPYQILDKLGEGGMGAVYKAKHVKLDKIVALKVLAAQVTRVPDAVQRFEREMRAVGKLEHPHIVRAMDAGEIDGIHYLAMEYVDGVDLQKLVKDRGVLTITNACKAIRQSAQALAAAHGAGLVHRDIKPSNLLVGKNGQIKVLDLGLALLAEDTAAAEGLTTAGQTFGTPDYMAPEQWEDAHSADPRTDLYALGCTLYYLLIGHAPYGTDQYRTAVGKMKGHVTQPIPELAAARTEVPAELAAIYRRLMAKDPADRFQKASELVEALAPFASSKAPAAPPRKSQEATSPLETTPLQGAADGPRRRSRRIPLASAGGAVLLLCGVIIITITNRDGTQTKITLREGTETRIDAAPGSQVKISQSSEPAVLHGNAPPPDRVRLASSQPTTPYEILTSPDYEWTPPENLGAGVNTPTAETYSVLSDDGLRLIFHSFGRANVGLSEATRARTDEPFGPAQTLGEEFRNRSVEAGIALSGDGLVLVFASKRPGGPGEPGNKNLWQATRPNLSTSFSKPVCLHALNSPSNDEQPWLSSDGLTIWFTSERDGRLTGAKWASRRASPEAEFEHPKPIEMPLLRGADSYPSLYGTTQTSDDRVLIFSPSYSLEGKAISNLLMTVRSTRDAQFGPPVVLDPVVNGANTNRFPTLSADGTVLVFQSDRPGGIGGTDLWISRRVRKTKGSTPPGETMNPARSPSIDLLHHPVVERFAQEAKGLRLENGALVFTSSEADGLAQVWVDTLKTRRGRVRAVLQALDPLPQGVVSVGWDYAAGTPRRIDAVIHAPQGKPAAAVWEFGPNFDVTPLVDEPIAVDLSRPIVIEHEFGEGLIRATIAGRTITTKLSAASDRLAFPYLGVKGTWKLTEWRMEDLDGAEPSAVAGAPSAAIAPFDVAQAKAHQEAWAKHLGLPVEREITLPGGEQLVMALIPPGDYVREEWRGGPQYPVRLTQPFYLGKYEVTQAQWQAVMGDNPSHFQGGPTDPLENVSWDDIQPFLTKLNQAGAGGGWQFELPTEAQWEHACRAGTTTMYWFGDDEADLPQCAWFHENSNGKPHPVGQLKPNPFGLYDVHGNVREWCLDWAGDGYYAEAPQVDPPGASEGSTRLQRGGSFGDNAANSLVTFRPADAPASRYFANGFRLALKPSRVSPENAQSKTSGSQPAPAKAPFDAEQARAHQAAWAKHLGVPVESTNTVGAKMILIPPGEFLMGAPEADADASPQEKPQHRVRLTKPFAIGATEVTNWQFRQFVEATKYVTQAESDGQGAFDVNPQVRKPSNTWNSPELKQRERDEHPVRCVSWEDARRFCEWLTQTEGQAYRLPTEAEWEFACRAGTATRYAFGDNFSDTASPPGSSGAPLRAVAQLVANPFGVFDMHGSVNEICLDSGRTFTAELVTDPLGSLATDIPAVVRGGAVSSHAIRQRSSNRFLNDARGFPESNFATIIKGFRVVRDFTPPAPIAKVPFDDRQARNHQESWAKHLGVPVEYTNSIGMTFRLIPPGEFTMGSKEEEIADLLKAVPADSPWVAQQIRDEAPARMVRIADPFYLAVHEVTAEQFAAFADTAQYRTADERNGLGGVMYDGDVRDVVRKPENTWRTAWTATGPAYPVGFVVAADAEAFCTWLTMREGVRYALPSEAQWEFACRAGTTGARFCDDARIPESMQLDPTGGKWMLFPVGGKLSNPFGLFDMLGNQQEIVRSDTGYMVRGGGSTWGSFSQIEARCAARKTLWKDGAVSALVQGFRVAVLGDLTKLAR